MAIELPYTLVPKRLQHFLERIPADGRPDKLTIMTLQERGFRSSNDRSLIRVIKALGLVDDNGVPTQAWMQYRDRSINRGVLAGLIRRAYHDLFNVFPDAHSRSEADITNFMVAKTKAPASTVRLMVSTFQTLCSLADFDTEEMEDENDKADTALTSATTSSTPQLVQNCTTPGLPQMQIVIHLPESHNLEVYDKIFISMARHLLGRETS